MQSVAAGGSPAPTTSTARRTDAGAGFTYVEAGGTNGAAGFGGVATDATTSSSNALVTGGVTETGASFESGGASIGGSLDAGGSANTGSVSSIGGVDAGGGTTGSTSACDWGSPTRAGLNIAGEQWSPNLSADDLTIYFSIYDGQNNRIYAATRATKNASFGIPVSVTVSGSSLYTTPAQPQSPFLSRDGLTLYFVANSSLGTDKDIWTATRATAAGTFGNAQALSSVNSPRDDLRPWLSDDELTIYFSSARGGGSGDFDIWTATRSARTAPFSTPINVESLNGAARDSSPFLSSDMLTAYFSSTRIGGTGSRDIWRATRTDIQSAFGIPVAIAALDSVALDSDVALSHDTSELFFSSEVSGTAQILRATLACSP